MTDTSSLQTLDDWLAHCERLHPKSIDMTLERVAAVRQRLGLRFDVPVIAVAGTNGKGSTCAMLDSIARAAGWRVVPREIGWPSAGTPGCSCLTLPPARSSAAHAWRRNLSGTGCWRI